MSYSESITKQDLTNILNGILPCGGESRTLLWTNPSPSSGFSAQDVTNGMSGAYSIYDYIEIVYLSRNDESADYGAQVLERTPCHAQTVASIVAYSNGWFLRHRARWWNSSATGIHFDSGFYTSLDNNSSGQNDNVLIPYHIWGIKQNKVFPSPTTVIDYITEEGTSGIWNYRKWNSGKAEMWGRSTATRSSATTNFKLNLPFSLDSSKHIGIQASGGATGYTDAYVMYVTCGASQTDIYVRANGGSQVWVNVYIYGTLA